jgi:excisionase family DNA binding protein
MPEFMTVAEAADLLRVNPNTVYRWLLDGQLRAPRAGRRWLITRAAIDELLVPAPPAAPPAPAPSPPAAPPVRPDANPLAGRKRNKR